MISAQHRRTLRVGAFVVLAAIVCCASTQETEHPSTSQLPSSNATQFANSTNEGEERSLSAASTQAATSDSSQPLGMTETAFTAAQPLSSDALATVNYTAPTGADSGSMTTSSNLVTSVATVSLAESVTSPAKIASETLTGGVSMTASEGGSPDTSAAVAVTTKAIDGSASSAGDAASSRAEHSTAVPATATAEIFTIITRSTTEETLIGQLPTSTSKIIESDSFTSQSNLTSMFITSAVNSVMSSNETVLHATLDTTISGTSTVLSSTDSINLDVSSSGALSTTQNGNIPTYSRTADAAATSTTAMSASPNVYSTVTLNVYDTVFTKGATSTGSKELSTLAVELSSPGTVNTSEVITTTLDSALSNESSLTTTNSRTISPMTAIHVASDNATSAAFTSAVGITSTETVSTASDSQRSVSNNQVTDEVRLASSNTVTTASLMNESTFLSSTTTEDASVFPNVTIISSNSSGGLSSSDMATASVNINTTSEFPVQTRTGYDTTRSDGEATSAVPVFTAEKETVPTLMSETVTQLSSITFATWSSNMSSTDTSVASYFHSTTSSGLPRSESSTSSHASTSWSTADNDTLQSSASTELPTALTGATSVLTSVSTVHSTSSNPPVFGSVTAPRDSSNMDTSTLSAFNETTAGNASTAQPIPFVSGSQALSSESAATFLLSNVSYSPTSSLSISTGAASSSEATPQSSTATDPIGSRPTTFTKASASEARSDVTIDVTNIVSSSSALSSSSFSALPSTKNDSLELRNSTESVTVLKFSDVSQAGTTITESVPADSTNRSIFPAATTQGAPAENATETQSGAPETHTTTTLLLTSVDPAGVSSNGTNSSTMHSQAFSYTASVEATTVLSAGASAALGLTSSTKLIVNSISVSHADTTASTGDASSSPSSLPIFVSSTNGSDVVLDTSSSSPVSRDLRSSVALENSVTAEVRAATTEDSASTVTDIITDLTTVNVSTQPSMAVNNASAGAEQFTSTSSAITEASPASAVGNNATISSQPDSTERSASADLSTAPTIGPNQTTSATAAGTSAAGAFSSALTTTAEQNSSSEVAATTAATPVSMSAVTSPASNFSANASSANSTSVTYFQSTPTLSTASQSVNSTEASRSTTSNLVTTASYSYNATEVSSASVADHTSMKPIRPNFTVEPAERKYGAVVQMITTMSIAKFESLRSSLQQELTKLTNRKCNSAPLFPTCCRQSGSRLTDDPWREFVKAQEVYLGQAQNPLVGQVWFVVAVAPEANNSLCAYGGSGSGKNASRNKRDVNLRDENILDPIALALILSNATSEIGNILGNLTNTTVVVSLVDPAEVVARQLEETTTGAAATTAATSTSVFAEGSSSLIAWVLPVTFILAAAILVIAVVVACRRKRRGSAKMVISRAHKAGAYSYELHISP